MVYTLSVDNHWRKNVQDKLQRNYKEAKDKLGNKQDAGAPIQLLMKAINYSCRNTSSISQARKNYVLKLNIKKN